MGRRSETRIVGDIVEKKCTKCHEFKALHEFHRSAHELFGVLSKCKECCKKYYQENREEKLAYTKEYQQNNKEVVNQRHRSWVLRNRYNLTPAEYHELAEHGCMICNSFENLCVDHDHVTNEVRGILCRDCNVVLGLLKDSVELLLKAAAYLESKQSPIPEIRSSAKSE